MKNLFFSFSALLLSQVVFAQQDSVKEKIGDAIAQYFELDRETIHAHFDKTTFFTNEQVWFKGYCFNKKEGTPFFETTNVYAELIDDSGKTIADQLIFSYIGTFSGNFKLTPQLASGRYYVRFYTNWMNNFIENESSSYPIQIINENERTTTVYDVPDYNSVSIAFFPEGGQLVRGVVNNLGIRVADCSGNPIAVGDAKIVDARGETVSTFIVGKTGNAKTYITPNGDTYRAVVSVNGKVVESVLPAAGNGLGLEINNYVLPGKTIVKLRGNKDSQWTKKSLFVVIQQNNKSTIFEVAAVAGQTEYELIFGNENLLDGLNTIRIIDAQLSQLAERCVFQIPDQQFEFSFTCTKSGDTTKVTGRSNFPNADLSISVLPDTSWAADDYPLAAAMLINPYLNTRLPEKGYAIFDTSKARRYELDLFLLNQRGSKYQWTDILSGIVKPNYEFDIGLSVKGTINSAVPNPKSHRMLLSSPTSLINDYSEINEKGEFSFKNLIFSNLANFKFTLLRIPSIPVNATIVQQLTNRRRPFHKPFASIPPCSPGRVVQLDIPQFGEDVIQLANIDITGKAKTELKYRTTYGNASLRGYKITDDYKSTELLNFIRTNGFDVTRSNGNVMISGRLRTTVNGSPTSPEVYINERRLLDFDELQYIFMDEVDEIYLNQHAIVSSMNNNMGVIKIYMKKITQSNKTVTQSVQMKDGFAPIQKFETPIYLSTTDDGFMKYGVNHWVPTVLTDAEGSFTLELPATESKSVTLHIQGFSPEGKMISEVKTITLP